MKVKQMLRFNWSAFKNQNNKIAVHCKTEAEANDFCRNMHEHGLTWSNDKSYLRNTFFEVYGKETCYTGYGTFCDYDYYERQGFDIVEWSDFMHTMTCREWMEIHHPENVDEKYIGGVCGCLSNYFLVSDENCDMDCKKCWNQPVDFEFMEKHKKEEKSKMEEKKLPTRDEIANALQTIKQVCMEQNECNHECPFECDGDCMLHMDNPSDWDINSPEVWKALV
ncbi:MAG: hypothetical protein ACI4CT_06190 [Lachnospiraceae bacterium]